MRVTEVERDAPNNQPLPLEDFLTAARASDLALGDELFTSTVDIDGSAACSLLAFCGVRALPGEEHTLNKIGLWRAPSREITLLTKTTMDESLPRIAPDGRSIAFVEMADSPRIRLYTFDQGTSDLIAGFSGQIEELAWAPNGLRLLALVAEPGSDISSFTGARPIDKPDLGSNDWRPTVDRGRSETGWRRLFVIDLRTRACHAISRGLSVWEASWCGTDAIAAIVSDTPDESAWYSARLSLLSVDDGTERVLHEPGEQIGSVRGSPEGRSVAVISAPSSDRGNVAGEALIIDLGSGHLRRIAAGCDITSLHWRNASRIVVAGLREGGSVVGEIRDDTFIELWAGERSAVGFRNPKAVPVGFDGIGFADEQFDRPPSLNIVGPHSVTCALGHTVDRLTLAEDLAQVESVDWRASDGRTVRGWLLSTRSARPWPIVMEVHGGPHAISAPRWIGANPARLALLRRGFAIFLPNPRGSYGRGREWARLVQRDVGGADAADLLSGVDELVLRNIAQSDALFVTGVSYGGYMASWLPTISKRFAAAVAICPTTDWTFQHLTNNIQAFQDIVLGTPYDDPDGLFRRRSPLTRVREVVTPILTIVGALDRCTPPSQGEIFHRALNLFGKRSILVAYPLEGHGLRDPRARIDSAVRLVDWFSSCKGMSNV